MERLQPAVSHLVRYGVSLRSDVRLHDRAILRLDKAMAHLAQVHAETDGKLNAPIDLEETIRRNGK